MTSGEPSLAVKIDSEKTHPLAWKAVAKRAAVVLVAGIALYLVFPAITEVLASWPRLSTLHPWWFTAARLATAFHASGCVFSLSILTARDGSPEVTDGSLTGQPARRLTASRRPSP